MARRSPKRAGNWPRNALPTLIVLGTHAYPARPGVLVQSMTPRVLHQARASFCSPRAKAIFPLLPPPGVEFPAPKSLLSADGWSGAYNRRRLFAPAKNPSAVHRRCAASWVGFGIRLPGLAPSGIAPVVWTDPGATRTIVTPMFDHGKLRDALLHDSPQNS